MKNWEAVLAIGKKAVECFEGVTKNFYERVQLLKTYILPLFIKIATIYLIPKKLVASLYAAIFKFIWGSGLNRVRRAITYNVVKEGGLGMINPEVFLSSFFLHYNLKTCLQDSPPPWAAILLDRFTPFQRIWEQGGNARKIILRTKKYPLYVIRAIRMVCSWDIRKEELQNSTRKLICSRITSDFYTEKVSLINCATNNSMKRVSWLWNKGLPDMLKSVNWLAIQNKLMVKSNVKHTRLPDLSFSRRSCKGVVETQSHIFIDCPFVKAIWKSLRQEFNIVLPLNYQDIVYGLVPGVHPEKHTMAINIILAVTKFYIWNARCALAWGREELDVEGVVNMIIHLSVGIVNKAKADLPPDD
ncbi:uncharacterized protein LOC135357053 [Latimeria chalumnae]|uniref:uncharacterized protein LOC135357053 n=1 Tax=Latimeria chalumnae TaxID=7897 RepID=UPI00313E5E5D